MKHKLCAIMSAVLLCALCVAPAHALECVATSSVSLASACGESSLTSLRLLSPQSLGDGFAGAPQFISGADDYLFGRPTSDDIIYEWENPNVDRSKNTALIPPGFGTLTSYLPGSGVYLTPNLVASQMVGAGTVNGSAASVTPPSIVTASGSAGNYPSSGTGFSTAPSIAVGFTEVTGSMYYSDGSLGVLKIPSIGLTVSVYEGTDSAALAKGAGHFENTSIWAGNCAIAGHNRGVRNDFGKIHTLNSGDIITLTTVLGTRTYAVSSVTKVSVNDVSGLAPSATNMITLYTCVMDQPEYRWCVRGVELAA